MQVDSFSTYFQKIGQGPMLVLLHGWGQSWDSWATIIPTLSEHFTLFLPDLPGFGQSQAPNSTGWNTSQYARWLDALIQNLPSTPIGLIGHSYGGKILLEYATSPECKICRIALISPSGIKLPESDKQRSLRALTSLLPRSIKNILPAQIKQRFYKNIVGETDYLLANEYQKATLRLILSEDYTTRAKKLPPNTLILAGKHDTSVPLIAMQTLQTNVPGSILKILPTGHFPFQEDPKTCTTLLKDYFHA